LDDFQKYIHLSKYARYLDKEKRRETWQETVNRYGSFFWNRLPVDDPVESLKQEFSETLTAIRNHKIMPSMRALMTAGKALDRDNVAGFNCAAVAINHVRCFDEIFYLLMNGCGVGFSVERDYVSQLPVVQDVKTSGKERDLGKLVVVRDSKIGWATGLREVISELYQGRYPTWDLTKVRPAGARLKTFGGRASGPGPLEDLFQYTEGLFGRAMGRQLTTLEVHDLVCKIAESVIVGSVRRAACISLSNLTDDRMRRAKMGEWWMQDSQRALANISTAYSSKPDLESFSKEMRSMHRSKAGERGIVNLEALKDKAESCGREHDGWYILNPCGEAILKSSGGLCNLVECVVRPDDTLETLKKKVQRATILGTLQSTLTDFRYLRSIWKKNAESERLLGVSLTGIMDHDIMSGQWDGKTSAWAFGIPVGYTGCFLEYSLKELKKVAYETNRTWADALGIPRSKQCTLVKPSGTVSKLVDSSSGIHPRMFPYYVQNVRQDVKDPLSDLMISEGVPYKKEPGEKYVFKFPMKSPEGSITQDDMTALDQLELWRIYREHWCDGNPSQTIHYREDEFFKICDWIWTNWDIVGGLSFFPKDDHVYQDPPFQKITKKEYMKLIEEFPKEINWERLKEFEKDDMTVGSQEFACSSGACDLI
jgi:ribonucleoside-diphosphate reductase alpha chain